MILARANSLVFTKEVGLFQFREGSLRSGHPGKMEDKAPEAPREVGVNNSVPLYPTLHIHY